MNMNETFLQGMIKRYEAASFFVTRRINALIQEKLPEDMTQEQFAIVRYLSSVEVSTSTELAQVFYVGKSTISSIVSRLVDKGLIRRVPDDQDRRVTHLSLTPEGGRLADETDRLIQNIIGRYMESFSDEQALSFIETFEALAVKLRD